jgi:hypothetical protein
VKSKLTPDEFDKTTIKIKDSPKEFTSSISGPPGILDKLKIGTAFKLIVMARVAAEGVSSAFFVKRYAETPRKLSVTLERVNVEWTVQKLAREYKLPEEEVRKRLNIPA